MNFSEFLLEQSQFQSFKDKKEPLDPEERKKAMKADAVWHPSNHPDVPQCAIWKAKDSSGKMWYCSNTHRAWVKDDSLEKAIKKFHSFTKTTA